MAAKSTTEKGAANSSATPADQDQTESSETALEVFLKEISGNPQFREVKPSGGAITILGARPPSESSATVRELFMKAISNNPRFVEAPDSGEAFGILGARPPTKR